jgi:hypothetical protein
MLLSDGNSRAGKTPEKAQAQGLFYTGGQLVEALAPILMTGYA